MEVVIDIPDYDLQSVENGSIACGQILKAVKNGIILPKGHGDLIDRNSITCENTWKEWSSDHNYYVVCIAPKVVEADKEAENGKS